MFTIIGRTRGRDGEWIAGPLFPTRESAQAALDAGECDDALRGTPEGSYLTVEEEQPAGDGVVACTACGKSLGREERGLCAACGRRELVAEGESYGQAGDRAAVECGHHTGGALTAHGAAFAMGYACELSGQPREVPPLRALGAPEGCEWSWAQGWDEARARRFALAERANDAELVLLGVRRTYAPPVDFDVGG